MPHTYRNFGLTPLQVVVVAMVICLLVGQSNVFFSEDGVLKQLQAEFPGTKRILSTRRNIIAKSIIYTEQVDGTVVTFLLDTDILGNYDLKKLEGK